MDPSDFSTNLSSSNDSFAPQSTSLLDTQPNGQPENYARALLIENWHLSIAFTLIYIPLLFVFIFKAVRNSTYVLWVTAFFCQVRIVSFAMRTVLARNETAGENFHLVLAEQIIYGVGFFGILYSAYILVLDRNIIKGTTGRGPLSRISGNRHLIRLALVAAVALSITGAIQANTGTEQKTIDLGKQLKVVSVVIFLVVAALLVLHTIFSIPAESRSADEKAQPTSLAPYGLKLLLLVGLLLLVREVFFLATSNKMSQYEERLFYPFAAFTELIAVLLFLIPGIIPLKSEVAEASRMT